MHRAVGVGLPGTSPPTQEGSAAHPVPAATLEPRDAGARGMRCDPGRQPPSAGIRPAGANRITRYPLAMLDPLAMPAFSPVIGRLAWLATGIPSCWSWCAARAARTNLRPRPRLMEGGWTGLPARSRGHAAGPSRATGRASQRCNRTLSDTDREDTSRTVTFWLKSVVLAAVPGSGHGPPRSVRARSPGPGMPADHECH